MKQSTLQKNVQAKLAEAKTAFEQAFQALQMARDYAEEGEMTLSIMAGRDLISLDPLDETLGKFGWSSSSISCW